MGINWELGVSDPMKGINTGLASLAQGLQDRQNRERQARLDEMDMGLHNIQVQKGQIELAELQRQAGQAKSLRDLLANPPTSPAVSNVASAKPAGIADLPGMNQFQPRTNEPFPQQQAPLSPTAQGSAASAGNMNAGVTPETKEEPERIAFNFLKYRDPEAAAEYQKKTLERARELAKGGAHEDAINLARSVGANMTYLGSKDNLIHVKNGDGTYTVYDAANQKSVTIGKKDLLKVGQGDKYIDPDTKEVVAQGEAKPDPESLLDKRLAATAAENEKNRKADAANLERRLSASERRGVGGGTGKPPVGYRYTPDGNLEAIPGGPADIKADEREAAAAGKKASVDITIRSIDDLLNHPGRSAATGKSGAFNKLAIPGTNRKGFLAKLDTLKAQTFIPQVAALKGMGALSDAEGKKLTDAVGALDPNMPEAEFEASLRQIRSDLEAAKSRIPGLKRMPNTKQQPAVKKGNSGNSSYSDLLNKHRK